MNIKKITDHRTLLGEGPVWSEFDRCLYWVDIKARRFFRVEETGASASWAVPGTLTCAVLGPKGQLIGAIGHSICRLSLGDAGDLRLDGEIARLPEMADHIRFNDGKVAPDGSLWVGTMDDEERRADGAWWRLDTHGGLAQIDTDYGVTNGPAFNEQLGRGYLTDSARRTIFVVDGWGPHACQAKRVLRTFDEGDGYPDGMTVDVLGRLWVAFWDGECVRALDPKTGDTLVQIDLPAKRPTSCAFGGSKLDTLYVTSARTGLASPSDADGALFAVQGDGLVGLPCRMYG